MKNIGSAVGSGQTREEWLLERRKYLGGSDAGKVLGVSRWGCPRQVAYDKMGVDKDFNDDDKMEFRRGNRLEPVAVAYYTEITGRETKQTKRHHVPGKDHLAVSMDRIVFKKEDTKRENPGYLEVKTLGRYSFLKIKKEGIPDEWIIQVQHGCAVTALTWGSYAIYSPELDELIHFDVVADTALGETILEKLEDFWQLNVLCKVLPESLPEGSKPCESCPWSATCRGSAPIPVANADIVQRPDLEGLVAKFAEVKGLSSEASDAEAELKAEIQAAIKEKPGKYRAGKWEFDFSITEQKRFSGDKLKKMNPALYESLREPTTIKKLNKPKEV